MENEKKLQINVSVTPLSKSEETLITGGFQEVTTNRDARMGGSNVNCFPPNSAKRCDNGNCGGCVCKSEEQEKEEGEAV